MKIHAESFEKKIGDLLEIGIESLEFTPPMYVQSIFGPAYSWAFPHRKYSEFSILSPWRPARALTFMRDVTVPSIAAEPPWYLRSFLPPIIRRTFWRPTGYFQQPDPYGSVTSFKDEHWFFINGICTNHAVARMNAAYIAELFYRPLTVIQNATNSMALDLTECVIGKGIKTNPNYRDEYSMTEPAFKATAAILDALRDKSINKIVVIAHSQGTIILSNVMQALGRIMQAATAHDKNNPIENEEIDTLLSHLISTSKDYISQNEVSALTNSIRCFCDENGHNPEAIKETFASLEVYPFANCANRMQYIFPENQYPFIENFANRRDLVARLGVLSPEKRTSVEQEHQEDESLVTIDGAVYENQNPWSHRDSSWGHLLNEHYLFPIGDYLNRRSKRTRRIEDNPFPPQGDQSSQTPRLYGYFNGGTPGPIDR